MTNLTSNSLASLFSEESKANFTRRIKPQEEFISKKRRNKEIEEEIPKKIKKPKHKHRKDLLTSTSDTNTLTTSTITNSESLESNNNSNNIDEKDQRTIFVGNIPITETVNSIRQYFSEFGQIDSVRIRSVPVAGTAVDDHGNQDLVRKVCINQGKFGEQKGSFNAYIVFKTKESFQKSFSANNRLMGTRHIRVDMLNPTLYNPRTSVFLGGLPYYTDEEELREHFAKVIIYSINYIKYFASFNILSLFLTIFLLNRFYQMIKMILLEYVLSVIKKLLLGKVLDILH